MITARLFDVHGRWWKTVMVDDHYVNPHMVYGSVDTTPDPLVYRRRDFACVHRYARPIRRRHIEPWEPQSFLLAIADFQELGAVTPIAPDTAWADTLWKAGRAPIVGYR